jgi:hypothetical protein
MPSEKDVETFVLAAKSYVQRTLNIELDGSETSLAFVDHYAQSARPVKDEILALVAPALGAYLGQIAIAKFGGHWVLESENPAQWRVELSLVPLRFFPVGMAAEAVRGDEVEGYDASFSSTPALMGKLLEALSRVPPVEEQYYYSLTGRLETLAHAVDILTDIARQNQEPQAEDEDE